MTEQATELPPAEPAPVLVSGLAGSKLEQLHAAYPEAKAAADAANERLKTITDGIKVEALTAATPDSGGVPRRIELRSSVGPTLRMTYSETWRFDSTRLKAENPELYVSYAKKSGSWRLAAVKDGE